MNLFVPYDDSDLARVALGEACRMLTPVDRITVMAVVLVPGSRAVDALPGEVWRQTCRAEVRLSHAREHAERVAHFGAGLRCVRVQARTMHAATLAGATHYAADTIVLAAHAGLRGRLAACFGPIHALLRHAPCDVRVVYKVAASDSRRRIRTAEIDRRSPAPIASLVSQQVTERGESGYPLPHQGGMTSYVSE